jgi:ABC-2 type transport system permease protein
VRPALRAEWTKLRTVPGPGWLLLGLILSTVALGPVANGTAGTELGQAFVAVLAVVVVSGEYDSGLIGTTLTAIPDRVTAFVAKAIVLSGAVAAAGTVAVVGSPAGAREILHLTLIALLGLGAAAAVRDSATGIGVVLGLLYLFPILARTIADPRWQQVLERIAPVSDRLTVTAAWAFIAVATGGHLLCRRDV